MFTGLVEERGTLLSRSGGRARIGARVVLDGVSLGDSIAVNGVCLTVVEVGDGWWEADLSPETIECSTLGHLPIGAPVNLERPVRVGDRLGGHIVQGHVDARGEVLSPAPELRVSAPAELAGYLVEKGSVAVDGVSLTIAGLEGSAFRIAVVPHTAEVTNLGDLRPGSLVNLEVDIMAKHAESLLSAWLHRTEKIEG